jgi:hypothetical protein
MPNNKPQSTHPTTVDEIIKVGIVFFIIVSSMIFLSIFSIEW